MTLGLRRYFVAYALVLAILFLPVAQVMADSSTVSPTYSQGEQSQTNGCAYPLYGVECIGAHLSTGASNQVTEANPVTCSELCSGGVGPFATYIYFDDNGSPNGATLTENSGTTLYLTIDARFNGSMWAVVPGITSANALLAYEMYLHRPGGLTIYVVDEELVTSGNYYHIISCDNGQSGVSCLYYFSISAPSTGTYYLGGGFATGSGASYNENDAASAGVDFYDQSYWYITVTGIELSTTVP